MSSQIIQNPKILTQDYIPDSFVHREGQHHEIADNLRPLMEGRPPSDMLLHGPPGAGKTAMSKFVIRKLKEELFIKDSYVNGFSHNSKFGVFYKLLDKPLTVPREGSSTDEVVELFKKKVRQNKAVIIIDEVDQIEDENAIYELSQLSAPGVIYISNTENVFSKFGKRVESRLSKVENIRFERYSTKEITDILDARRNHGLKNDAISDTNLEILAERSEGDARIAVNSLRKAARKAEKLGADKITKDIVQESVDKAIEANKTESLGKLNSDQKEIYGIIQEEQPVRIGKIFQKYKSIVKNNKSKRTVKRYLSKMQSYGLVESIGEKSSTKYKLAS